MKQQTRKSTGTTLFHKILLHSDFYVDGIRYHKLVGHRGMDEDGGVRRFADSQTVREAS